MIFIFLILILILIIYLDFKSNKIILTNFVKIAPKAIVFTKKASTSLLLIIFLYFATFPLYHEKKPELKKKQALEYEKYQQKYNSYYKKKLDLNLTKNVFDQNLKKGVYDKEDYKFFLFPWRMKKRIFDFNNLILDYQNTKKEIEQISFEIEQLKSVTKFNQIDFLKFEELNNKKVFLLEHKHNLKIEIVRLKNKFGFYINEEE